MSQCPASHYCICCQPGRKVPGGGPGSSLGPWKRPGACAIRGPQSAPQRTRRNLPEVLGSVGLSPRVPKVIGVGFWFCLGEGFPFQAGRLPSLWRLCPLGMRAQGGLPSLRLHQRPTEAGAVGMAEGSWSAPGRLAPWSVLGSQQDASALGSRTPSQACGGKESLCWSQPAL